MVERGLPVIDPGVEMKRTAEMRCWDTDGFSE